MWIFSNSDNSSEFVQPPSISVSVVLGVSLTQQLKIYSNVENYTANIKEH